MEPSYYVAVAASVLVIFAFIGYAPFFYEDADGKTGAREPEFKINPCDGVSCSGKLNHYGHLVCHIRVMDPKMPNTIQYLVQHDIETKLPEWSMYFQPKASENETSVKTNRPRFKQLPCPNLKGFQRDDGYYQDLGRHPFFQTNGHAQPLFQRGHLVPNGAFREASQRHNTFLHVNAAPQLANMNNAWGHGVERSVKDFINEKSTSGGGFVITGIYHEDDDRLPDLFWKIMCTEVEGGLISSGFFFHNNTAPPDADSFCQLVNDYTEEMVEPRSLAEFERRFPVISLDEIWDTWERVALPYYKEDAERHKKLITECRKEKSLPLCPDFDFPKPERMPHCRGKQQQQADGSGESSGGQRKLNRAAKAQTSLRPTLCNNRQRAKN